MNQISIKDMNNQIVEVFLVRYFKYKNTNYLIYTLNETDEKGFIKLYIVKLMKQFNEWIAKTIKDEEEWKRMQLIVKNILKEIKNSNIESFIDLDVSEINNIKIQEARYFKLEKNLKEMLTLNTEQNIIEDIQMDELPKMEEIAPVKIEINEESLVNSSETINIIEDDETNNIEMTNINEYVETISPEIASINEENIQQVTEELDYKKLYLELKKDNEELNEVMSDMLLELGKYRAKYGKIEG